MLSLVLIIVSRALSAVSSAMAKRSAAARRTDSSRNTANAAKGSDKSAPDLYAFIKLSYSDNPLYSISNF